MHSMTCLHSKQLKSLRLQRHTAPCRFHLHVNCAISSTVPPRLARIDNASTTCRIHSLCSSYRNRKCLKRQRFATNAVASSQPATIPVQTQLDRLKALKAWTEQQFNIKIDLEPKVFRTENDGTRIGLIAARDVMSNEALLELPDKAAITSADALDHPLVGPAAELTGGFELSALALWLMAERAAGQNSFWHSFIQTLPDATDSPLLWEEAERQELLQGTTVAADAAEQAKALELEWQRLYDEVFSKDTQKFPQDVFNQQAYLRAFSVVAAYSSFLPSAQCWALLPFVGHLNRNAEWGMGVDFDLSSSLVKLTAGEVLRGGSEVRLLEERPNSDLLLATGTIIPNNPNDFVLFKGELVAADRYWQSKRAIVEQAGFGSPQYFPVFKDRMPLQLFAYLRLARIQEPLLFAKVSFEQDVKLSDINEYEILQLLLGDCREKLFAFAGNSEDDVKLLQDSTLSTKVRLATQLRLSEKQIVASAMDAVRRKLAPIRGIPVKGGKMEDPNKDLLEIFEFIETLPQQPGKFFKNVFGLDEQQR